MGEKDPQAAWLEGLVAAQREFWQPFLAGQPAPPPPPFPGAAPFMQPGAPLPETAAELSRKMMDFGEGYLGVVREFWSALEAAGPAAGGQASPADLTRQLEGLRDTFTAGFARLYGGAPGGTDLFEAWRKLAGGAPGQSGWPFPALGPARERHEAGDRLAGAWARYQRALGHFGEVLGRVSTDAVQRLATRVARAGEGGAGAPGSLRALYDLWVNCGEEAYAAAAHGPGFAKAQAELNDALMELKAEQRRQIEDWAKAFDLPTRTELNTLLKRVNTLRRRMRELEDDVEQLRRSPRP